MTNKRSIKIIMFVLLLVTQFGNICFANNESNEQNGNKEEQIIVDGVKLKQEDIDFAKRTERKINAIINSKEMRDEIAKIKQESDKKLLELQQKLAKEKPNNELDKNLQIGLSAFTGAYKENIDNKPKLLIFISLSLPKNTLLKIGEDAKKVGAVVVLRGLKNNSYKETALYLKDYIEQTGSGIIVDPLLFSEYNVKSVPNFIITLPKNSCNENMSCTIPLHDMLSGNVSLSFALDEFISKGEVAALHKQYLTDLRKRL